MSFPNPRHTPGSVMTGTMIGDYVLFDDFVLSNVDATINVDAGWFGQVVTGGTHIIKPAEPGGVLQLDGAGTTNQGVYCIANGSSFTVAKDKDIYFETRIKTIEPTACDVFLGLGTIENTPLDVITDGIGFGTYDGSDDLLDGGTGDIYYISKAGSSATAWSLTSTLADTGVNLATTYHTLAFHVISNQRIKFFVDGVEKASITTNIPTGAMTVHMAMLENSGSDPELLVDYIYCAQTR